MAIIVYTSGVAVAETVSRGLAWPRLAGLARLALLMML